MDCTRELWFCFSVRRYKSVNSSAAEDRTLTKVQKKWIEECSIDPWTLMMWRPVMAEIASFKEVRDEWTLDELLDCIEQLDYQYDLEKEHYDNLQKE